MIVTPCSECFKTFAGHSGWVNCVKESLLNADLRDRDRVQLKVKVQLNKKWKKD